MDALVIHFTEDIGVWQWLCSDHEGEPEVVACCGIKLTL